MAGLGFARPWTLGARASWWGLPGPLGLLVRPVLLALSALLAPRAPLARKALLVRPALLAQPALLAPRAPLARKALRALSVLRALSAPLAPLAPLGPPVAPL